MIDIRDISGDIRLSVQINSGAKGVCSLGGDDYVTLPLVTDTPIPFAVGDYIDLRDTFGAEMGGRLAKVYRLLSVPKPNASPGRYEYELRFDAYYKEWNNKIFKYNPEIHGQEASWSLTAPLDMHLGIFLRNLKAHGFRYDGVDFDFTIDSTVSTKAVAMTYDNMHLLDALYALCAEDKLDCDCWIEGKYIRFGRCEHGTAVTLELGAEVAEMSRSESSGTYANRIYAFGGDRNIPADYRPTTEQTVVNGVVQHRLMLPEGTPYVDARPGLTEAEIVEAVKVFDDIYPRRTGTMSDVHTRTGTETNDDGTQTTYTYYRYKDTGLVFKEEYILPGKELQIVFTSGKLNGMTFGVIFNPSPKDSARGEQLWEIVANEDYGRLLPDDTLKPEDGNTYILSGFDIQLVSDQYIPDAEQELLEAAQEYVRKSGVDDGSYQAALYSDWVYADRIGRTFDIGQKVLLKNPAYFGAEGRESRITGWEFNLDLPYDSPRYTIGESVQYSRLGSIEDSLEALTYKGQTYTGGGGSGVYVIRTNDTTPASDSNVFSALRSLRQFTRKDIDDVVNGLLSFAYTSGTLGTGFGLFKDVDGMSYLELDRLYVRYKAIFDTLEVKHISHVGGEFVVSPAGMECIRVEQVSGIPSAGAEKRRLPLLFPLHRRRAHHREPVRRGRPSDVPGVQPHGRLGQPLLLAQGDRHWGGLYRPFSHRLPRRERHPAGGRQHRGRRQRPRHHTPARHRHKLLRRQCAVNNALHRHRQLLIGGKSHIRGHARRREHQGRLVQRNVHRQVQHRGRLYRAGEYGQLRRPHRRDM